MKKAGHPTYLNEDEETLLVASDDIKGGHGLPLDCSVVAKHMQKFLQAMT